MKLQAVGERIVVKPLESPKQTPGGIHLVEDNEMTYTATVQSVGQDVKNCEPKQVVLLSKAAGLDIEANGEKLVVVEDKHILAIVSV